MSGGVLITGKDDVKLRSSNGLVTVAVPAGSVSSPITSNYHEAGFFGMPVMLQGFTGLGVSVTSLGAGGCPVDLQQMQSITVAIGPDELALAEDDYWRFVIHHYLDRFQNWEALPIQAGSPPSAVAAQVGDLSLFALMVGPEPVPETQGNRSPGER